MAAMSSKTLDWIDRHLVIVLLAVAWVRIGFLLGNGLDLIGDESYYWDWSRQPDWCYYSKPPMVAWIIGFSTWLLGDVTWAVRLPTVVLGTAFLWFFHATAKSFYGARTGALALLLVLATPINVIANFLMTIDPPLYCFWMMALYFLRRALFDGDGSAWWWAGCASAAALLSKQAAVILPILLLLFLLWDKTRRVYLRRAFWFYLLPVIVAAVPILYWNAEHDWVMFGHSRGHFGNSAPLSAAKHIQLARDFLFYQLLFLSPVIFGLVFVNSVRMLRNVRVLSAEQRFLFLFGPALLLATLLLSLGQKAQGNWPMAFYFTALIALAEQCAAGKWRRWFKVGISIGYAMAVLTYLLPVVLQVLRLQGSDFDPTKRFKNWHELAAEIHFERLMAQDKLGETFVVALGHRYLASQLAFYLPDHPKVYRFEASGRVASQYEVWSGPVEWIGKNAFIVTKGGEETVPSELKAGFARMRFLAQIPDPGKQNTFYSIYLGENLQHWPESVTRSSDAATED